ncbi:phytanoyl-CoA dioxygenase family protein [Acidiferrimicrobium sp. IK]|uniref:phytanoyl-CoA dioxygenase family protein n=1 Tax=Acidiferrimicrobium sp. IK TaxID=2871700 RepID=UPI0021CAE7D8|nr:phytanoyl-CoA dioxygenase family protein [Acidiferrimicrobium sp. IK]MCU4186326.1 phytanoyl-CoA dioxygenase family protein [Acidiferrimicrobium sp. IK]
MRTLTTEQMNSYDEYGYAVVEGVLSAEELEDLRRVTEAFCAPDTPKDPDILDIGEYDGRRYVRRIKSPHLQHPVFRGLVRHPQIADLVQCVVGEDIRLYGTKMNLKLPSGDGDAIQWHQDWAYYPHTNTSLVAVGILVDDMTEENGPLMIVPGSHRGPIHDHHAEGVFCGAIDHETLSDDIPTARQIIAPAGSISLHHVMAVHASGPNHSTQPRRVIFHNYRAADAWPLVGCGGPGHGQFCAGGDFSAYNDLMVRGVPRQVRLEAVPVRLPLPRPADASSVYTTQRHFGRDYFNSARRQAVRS